MSFQFGKYQDLKVKPTFTHSWENNIHIRKMANKNQEKYITKTERNSSSQQLFIDFGIFSTDLLHCWTSATTQSVIILLQRILQQGTAKQDSSIASSE